ncbi:hypothetical protein IT157_09895 [bacterium]|nr:hypothetical protein [bacterium]
MKPATRGDYTGFEIEAPTGRDFEATWCYGETLENRVVFTKFLRTLDGFVLEQPELELRAWFAVSDDGRGFTMSLNGESSREITLKVDGQISEFEILVDGRVPAKANFLHFDRVERSATFHLKPDEVYAKKARRKLDVVTESDEANRAIVLLQTLLPHVQDVADEDSTSMEFWAKLTEAQWIAYGEAQQMFSGVVDNKRWPGNPRLVEWPAYRTIFSWGAYPRDLSNAMRDALAIFVASKFDRHPLLKNSTSEQILSRTREAAVFNFAEQYLTAEQVGPNRSLFRERASEAVNDVQRELRNRAGREPIAIHLLPVPVDKSDSGEVSWRMDVSRTELIDSVELFRTASWGNITWLSACGEEWLTTLELPWDLEQARLRHRFNRDPMLRETQHWNMTITALADSTHRGMLLPSDAERKDQWLAAASEIETITKSYLGIQPNFQQGKLTLDPRLPLSWGRTRARIPYSTGELFVDYDFAQKQATVAYNGVTDEISCLIYFPLPSGRSMPGQFSLSSEERSKRITLTLESGNEFRLIFDDADFPE